MLYLFILTFKLIFKAKNTKLLKTVLLHITTNLTKNNAQACCLLEVKPVYVKHF